jgi:hypothetical protein
MFLDESHVCAKITHPNVGSGFDVGEVEGAHSMAMECLVGEPLSTVVCALQKRPDIADAPHSPALAATKRRRRAKAQTPRSKTERGRSPHPSDASVGRTSAGARSKWRGARAGADEALGTERIGRPQAFSTCRSAATNPTCGPTTGARRGG